MSSFFTNMKLFILLLFQPYFSHHEITPCLWCHVLLQDANKFQQRFSSDAFPTLHHGILALEGLMTWWKWKLTDPKFSVFCSAIKWLIILGEGVMVKGLTRSSIHHATDKLIMVEARLNGEVDV